MPDSNDTPYYLSDATVREVRKALDCLFIAVDESIAGEVSAKVRAGFEAVAVVAEAKGVAASLEALEHMGACNERVAAERDALRETVRDLKDVDAFRLTKLEQFAATIERLTQDAEREGLEWLADAEKQAMELEYEADNAYRHAVFTLPQRTAAIASSIVQSIRHARADFTRRATPDTEGE